MSGGYHHSRIKPSMEGEVARFQLTLHDGDDVLHFKDEIVAPSLRECLDDWLSGCRA